MLTVDFVYAEYEAREAESCELRTRAVLPFSKEFATGFPT